MIDNLWEANRGGKSGTQPEGLKQISPGQSEAAKPQSAALGHEAT